jgi:predicted nucleic acid-binding protein
MLLIDVNVLVYAYREDAPNHSAYHRWLTDIVAAGEPFGVADLALSGFLRITTHPSYAAIAIEGDWEWITTDREFGRFPGLRWRHPLSGA